MKPFVRLLALVGVFVLFLAVASSAFGSSGPMLITTDTTLTEDHYGPIGFGADSVTLDCAGHSVIGPSPSGGGIGVFHRSHVTIRNCHVTGFQYAITMIEDMSSVVVGNRLSNNVVVGLDLVGSENGTFSGNVMSSNRYGLIVTRLLPTGLSARNNQIAGNTAANNSDDGFLLREAESNQLIGNRSVGNGGRGFSLVEPSFGTTLVGNMAFGNGSDGFVLDVNSKGHVLDGNTAIGNGGSGFSIASSSNRLTGNSAFLNKAYGFAARAGANTIEHNIARWNKLYDAYQQDPGSPNRWHGNWFGTTYGF